VSIAALIGTLWFAWGKLGYRASAGRLGAALGVAGVALWLEPVQQTLQFGQINLVLMVIIVAPSSRLEAAAKRGLCVLRLNLSSPAGQAIF